MSFIVLGDLSQRQIITHEHGVVTTTMLCDIFFYFFLYLSKVMALHVLVRVTC